MDNKLRIVLCCFFVISCTSPEVTIKTDRPNLLLIVADDLGYTDLGVYGSEIPTPNLDALAHDGVLFSSFYTAATCSPTRSMLLTSTDNHLAGFGTMSGDHVGDQLGAPGYETYLNFRVASLSELLQEEGYATFMTGKWHLGGGEDVIPSARGFNRSFVLIEGGGGHFDNLGMFSAERPATYLEDGEPVELPPDFYSTKFFADKMIDYIRGHDNKPDPFFGFLAFTAPHWPLQAPDSSIARHRGDYDDGYDALFKSRMNGLVQAGIISSTTIPHPGLPGIPAWEDLSEEEKRIEARKMEIYAAMVSDLDLQVGNVINHLKENGQYDNTFIVFMSDNGAEGHNLQETWPFLKDWIAICCDNSYENMGRGNSYLDYGPAWARAGIGPFRMYKGFANEGGIRAPAFIHYHTKMETKGWINQPVTVMDIMPTMLQLAGVTHPAEENRQFKGRDVLPMQGVSLWPFLSGQSAWIHGEDPVFGWELFGRRAIRKGDWKLVWTTRPFGPSDWELFNLESDPGEITDVSEIHPDIRSELLILWEKYVYENGVVVSEEILAY